MQLEGGSYTEMTGRVYSGEGLSPKVKEARFFQQAIETFENNEVKNGDIIQILICIFELCEKINKEDERYEEIRNLLQILWEEIGKEEIWEAIGRFYGVQSSQILRQNMHEKSDGENGQNQSNISSCTSNCKKYNEVTNQRTKMLNLWQDWKTRYTPYRWELSKQQFEQFNLFMSELPHENSSPEIEMQDMRKAHESIRILRETLSAIQKNMGIRIKSDKISNKKVDTT